MAEPSQPRMDDVGAVEFGRAVMGPIFAEFALRLWMSTCFVARPSDVSLLYCARGGLRLQIVVDRLLGALGLRSPVASDVVMVSRLVAARAALLRTSPGAMDEILREFHGQSLNEVAAALSGGAVEAPPEAALTRETLLDLVTGDHPAGRALREILTAQTDLFREHVRRRAGSRTRVMLCDTGLYGSTIRLLGEGLPDIEWTSVLFARSNYKRFDVGHFARTLGISIEQDRYSPLNPRTSALRFWHLIESVLEPPLDSVVWFERRDGEPRSNLETDGWRDRVRPSDHEIFAGALAYIDELKGRGVPPAQVFREADVAWASLKRTIVWPRGLDVRALTVPERSRDFGRSESVAQFAGERARGRLAVVRDSLWREGRIAQMFPVSRPIILAGLEGVYAGRDAIEAVRRRLRRR